MNVRIVNLRKRFGPAAALDGVSFDVADRELFFLLGPSGCGKTTLLRAIAGFCHPDDGELWFGDRRMNRVEPHRRNTGMVFQNYALWPHMSVAENVAYGLTVRRVSREETNTRVTEALRTVRMEPFADRSPTQLSGGQQQRVALARALVVRPDVLLLDEPLSNLDARLRIEMREEIRRIHDEIRVTTVYVTHDQKEALSMADRMAILRDGRLEQLGKPRDVYRRPANRFVADFIGEANWLPASVVAHETPDGPVIVDTPVGRLVAEAATRHHRPGDKVDLGFRPESMRLSRIPDDSDNVVSAAVLSSTYLGDMEQYALELSPGLSCKALATNTDALLPRGSRIRARIAPSDLFLLPETS